MHQYEIGRQRGRQKMGGHTREGPDVFSRTSLSDIASIDGGSHGVEGEDERDKSEMGLRFYRVGGRV